MALAWPAVTAASFAGAWLVTHGGRADRIATLPPRAPRLSRRPSSWPSWAWTAARRGLADAVGGLLLLRDLARDPRPHALGLAGYPIYWAGHLLCLDAALQAFDAHPSLIALILAFTTGYAATALPLPVGGAGGIEASLAFTLNAVGIPLAAAVLATLVYRVVTFWLPLGPALVALTSARRLDDDLARIGEAASAPA